MNKNGMKGGKGTEEEREEKEKGRKDRDGEERERERKNLSTSVCVSSKAVSGLSHSEGAEASDSGTDLGHEIIF